MKKFLIINSRPEAAFFADLFGELENRRFDFYLLSSDPAVLSRWQEGKKPARKIGTLFGLTGSARPIFFYPLFPAVLLAALFFLLYYKIRKNIGVIICFGLSEKLVFTPAAAFLNLKTVWIELPGEDCRKLGRFPAFCYGFFCRRTEAIVFDGRGKDRLAAMGVSPASVHRVNYGIDLNRSSRQESIFSRLAQADQEKRGRKYFTIGTSADLNGGHNIETLFQAVRKCLSVMPDIQLVIVGEGRERKSLSWLAKKMGIDGFVWFVGEQRCLKKWFDGFDVYAVVADKMRLHDLDPLIRACAAGLPIIGPADIGMEDLAPGGRNGIITEGADSESLAQAIIKLRQNVQLRLQMGRQSRETAAAGFTLETMAERISDIFLKIGA